MSGEARVERKFHLCWLLAAGRGISKLFSSKLMQPKLPMTSSCSATDSSLGLRRLDGSGRDQSTGGLNLQSEVILLCRSTAMVLEIIEAVRASARHPVMEGSLDSTC